MLKDINSINFEKQEYVNFKNTWNKIRIAISGQDEIKKSKENILAFLPPLSGHLILNTTSSNNSTIETNSKYDTYKEYAQWFGASGRTVNAMVGIVFRKVPKSETPKEIEPIIKDITLKNESAMNFSMEILREVISVFRCGVLIDMPQASSNELTKKQIENENLRPYARIYKTESIINWSEHVINNIMQTDMVVLKEEIESDDYTSSFENKKITQYRVLSLEPFPVEMPNGEIDFSIKYVQFLVREQIEEDRKGKQKINFVQTETIIIKANDEFVRFIPFFPITEKGINWNLDYPNINALVDINISHFRNSANLENGLIWTGNPTPWVSGYGGKGNTLNLGSTEVLDLEQGGSAGYMEFTGSGLDPLRNSMKDKELLMATIGGRMLSPNQGSNQTAETASIYRAGEQGILGSISNTVSDAMTRIIKIIALWSGVDDTSIYYKLNTDYVDRLINGSDMISLLQMYQSGTISIDVLRWNLRQGERIPSEITNKEIDKQIEEDKSLNNISVDSNGMPNDGMLNV